MIEQMLQQAQMMQEQNPQSDGITVLHTASGNDYCFVLSMNEDLDLWASHIVDFLRDKQELTVALMVHVWRDGTLDVPAYALRKQLTLASAENLNALMIVQGENGIMVRPIL